MFNEQQTEVTFSPTQTSATAPLTNNLPILINFPDTVFLLLKGSVQRKLRWVESGVFLWVWASYCGAGCYFVDLGGLHLVYNFFPFSDQYGPNYRRVLNE